MGGGELRSVAARIILGARSSRGQTELFRVEGFRGLGFRGLGV